MTGEFNILLNAHESRKPQGHGKGFSINVNHKNGSRYSTQYNLSGHTIYSRNSLN